MSVGERKAEVTEDTPESGVGMLQVPDDVPKLVFDSQRLHLLE